MTCLHCPHRTGNIYRRGLCEACYRALRAEGRLDTLYPPKKPRAGAGPLEWHGRKYVNR